MLITNIPGSSFIVYGTLDGKPVKKITPGLIGKIVNKCEGLRALEIVHIVKSEAGKFNLLFSPVAVANTISLEHDHSYMTAI